MAHSLTMADRNPQTQDKYIVRFPEGMRDEIKRSADLHGRSLNAEIIQRLRQPDRAVREDLFALQLSPEVQELISIDALAQGKSDEERAVEILTGHYDINKEYSNLLDKIYENAGQIAILQDEINILKQRLERDFVLYFNKVMQLRHFAQSVAKSGSNFDEVRTVAQDLVSLTEAETAILKHRAEDAEFWVARRDIERENERDAANEGRGNDD